MGNSKISRESGAAKWLINVMVLAVPLAVSTSFYWPVTTPKLFLLLCFSAALLIFTIRDMRGGSFATSRLHLAALAFGIVVAVSAAVSGAPIASFIGKFGRFEGLLAIVVYLTIFLAASQAQWQKNDLVRLATFASAGGLLVGIYGLFQYLGLDPINWSNVSFEANRVFSTYGNPALLTAYLVLVLPVAAVLAVTEKPLERALGIAATAVITIAIMTSYTRSGWLALLPIFIVLVFLVGRKHRRRLIAVMFLGLALSGLLMAKDIGQERTNVMEPTERLASAVNIEGGSVADRVSIWKQTVALIGQRPILGFGPGNFAHAYLANEPEHSLRSRGYKSSYPDNAHNQFFELLATTGFLGALAYIVFVILVVQAALSMRKKPPDEIGLFGAAAAAAVVGYLINASFQVMEPESGFLLWLLAGIVASNVSIARRPSPRLAKALFFPAAAVSSVLMVLALSFLVGDYYFLEGMRSRGRGELGAAELNLRFAVQVNPLMAEYRQKLAETYYALAEATNDTRYLSLALAAMNSAQALDPLDYRVPVRKGTIYLAMGGKVDSGFLPLAMESTEQALMLRPLDADARLIRGQILLEQSKARAAVAELEKALRVWPQGPQIHYNLGLALTEIGDKAGARRAFAKADLYRQPSAR